MGKRIKFWGGFGRAVLHQGTWKWVLCAGLGFVLAGCASDGADANDASAKPAEQTTQTTIPGLENFTTVGKPTKTIQTPNGTVEIYDPTQDPEVQAAIDNVFFLEKAYTETKKSRAFLKRARMEQHFRLLQSGCKASSSAHCETCWINPEYKAKNNQDGTYSKSGLVCFSPDAVSYQTIDGRLQEACGSGSSLTPYFDEILEKKKGLSIEQFSRRYFSAECTIWH